VAASVRGSTGVQHCFGGGVDRVFGVGVLVFFFDGAFLFKCGVGYTDITEDVVRYIWK